MKRYFIKDGNKFLDTYGPTQDEMTWVDKKRGAFRMDLLEADSRIVHVRKFFPNAVIVEG